MQYLPDDILLHIFSFLRALDLIKVSCVTKRFHSLCNEEKLWKSIVHGMNWEESEPITIPNYYKRRFIQKFKEEFVHEVAVSSTSRSLFRTNSATIISYLS
jgi:hypothetical protein